MSEGWFLMLGGLMYFWISISFIPFVAQEKGRSMVGWALWALFASPLLALIGLAAVPSKGLDKP